MGGAIGFTSDRRGRDPRAVAFCKDDCAIGLDMARTEHEVRMCIEVGETADLEAALGNADGIERPEVAHSPT